MTFLIRHPGNINHTALQPREVELFSGVMHQDPPSLGFSGAVRLFFGTLILFPIRIVLAAFVLVFFGFFAEILTLGMPRKHMKFSSRRARAARQWWRLFSYTMVRVAGLTYSISGIRPPRAPGFNPAYVANHTGWLDTLLVISSGATAIVAKAPVARVPIIGEAARMLGAVFVDRRSAGSRQKAKEALEARMLDPTTPPVAVFPEGTTSNGTCLLPFKAGVFGPGLPVVPTLISFPSKPGRYSPTWDVQPFFHNVWRVFSQLYTPCHIRFLDVYYPSDAERADAVLYANNVRALMIAEGGLHDTRLTLREKLLYQDYCDQAWKLGPRGKDNSRRVRKIQRKPSSVLLEWERDVLKPLLDGRVQARSNSTSPSANPTAVCPLVGQVDAVSGASSATTEKVVASEAVPASVL
jgi:lysophosphatidylcholine acyltransferase/lyso-PAF acetyltransferase